MAPVNVYKVITSPIWYLSEVVVGITFSNLQARPALLATGFAPKPKHWSLNPPVLGLHALLTPELYDAGTPDPAVALSVKVPVTFWVVYT